MILSRILSFDPAKGTAIPTFSTLGKGSLYLLDISLESRLGLRD
jgi:hypothetical protein